MAPAEHNYHIYDKELLAIIKAFHEWKPELLGLRSEERFEVLSDHRALEYFITTKALSARKSNVLADTLTRRRDEEARNLDYRNLIMLLKEKLDNRILAELVLMDITKEETTGNVVERVLAANEEFTGTEQAQDWLIKDPESWRTEDARLLF
ncbi:hypothetical protein TMatcc_008168 [Talaromyces marneffei ATCC 18224]